MNRQERERILASLTDDELEELRSRAGDNADAPGDTSRQFLRAINADRDRDWIAEISDRLGLPAQPKPRTFAQIFTDEPTL